MEGREVLAPVGGGGIGEELLVLLRAVERIAEIGEELLDRIGEEEVVGAKMMGPLELCTDHGRGSGGRRRTNPERQREDAGGVRSAGRRVEGEADGGFLQGAAILLLLLLLLLLRLV